MSVFPNSAGQQRKQQIGVAIYDTVLRSAHCRSSHPQRLKHRSVDMRRTVSHARSPKNRFKQHVALTGIRKLPALAAINLEFRSADIITQSGPVTQHGAEIRGPAIRLQAGIIERIAQRDVPLINQPQQRVGGHHLTVRCGFKYIIDFKRLAAIDAGHPIGTRGNNAPRHPPARPSRQLL